VEAEEVAEAEVATAAVMPAANNDAVHFPVPELAVDTCQGAAVG